MKWKKRKEKKDNFPQSWRLIPTPKENRLLARLLQILSTFDNFSLSLSL